MDLSIIVVIVTIILLAIFLVAVIIGYQVSGQVPQTATINNGDYLTSCATGTCNSGYECDGFTFLCKKSFGQICGSYFECANGMFCSGRCVTGPSGTLNQFCPCNSNFECQPQSNGFNLCKGLSGATCKTNTDCISFNCLNQVCTDGAALGVFCTQDSDCAEGYCSLNYCQPTGYVTGQLGAFCGSTSYEAVCTTTGLICENGNCYVETPQGLFSPCTEFQPCYNTSVCISSTGTFCEQLSTGCSCQYPYPNPNAGASGLCIDGMQYEENPLGECYNSSDIGCSTSPQCASNSCSQNGTLMVYQMPIDFVFATDFGVQFLASIDMPSTPYKMFGTSTSDSGTSQDIINICDHTNGLLQYILPYTGLPEVIIPYEQINGNNKKIFIDAAYYGSNFIVAFLETAGNVTTTTVYIVVVIGGTYSYTPFNPTVSTPGTQFYNGREISIKYINAANNDSIIVTNGVNIFVLTQGTSVWTLPVISGGPANNTIPGYITGPVMFYSDSSEPPGVPGTEVCPYSGAPGTVTNCPQEKNFAFIGRFNDYGTRVFNQVVQFSGNIAGAAFPTDSIGNLQYNVFDFSIYSGTSMQVDSAIMMLTDIGVVVCYAGRTLVVPLKIDSTFRCCVTKNAYYVFSPGRCA